MEQAAEPVGAIAASVVFGAVILKLLDALKYLLNLDVNGLVTIATGWIAGIAAIWLMLQTQWADEITIGSETLAELSFWSKVVLGFVASSVAGVLYDFKKAVDNTDSAATPKLLGKTSAGESAERQREAQVAAATPKIGT